jgi:hypothetical protein
LTIILKEEEGGVGYQRYVGISSFHAKIRIATSKDLQLAVHDDDEETIN